MQGGEQLIQLFKRATTDQCHGTFQAVADAADGFTHIRQQLHGIRACSEFDQGAIDIEEQQQVAREFRAFRDAQRALLDQLSVGVALFDADERLTFANRPFRRLFSLTEEAVDAHTPFERFLAEARERGRTPEVRDFPEWRRERQAWFLAREPIEESWHLSGGTHLRVVGQPMPDGGLILITEDRTESLALSAVRDTLLRTRTATLDSLFEALAIFAPDGSVQLWNRSFAGTWGLSSEFLDTHPSADGLLTAIGRNLVRPEEASLIGAAVREAEHPSVTASVTVTVAMSSSPTWAWPA